MRPIQLLCLLLAPPLLLAGCQKKPAADPADLRMAAGKGDMAKVQTLLAQGVNVNAAASWGGTALHEAAANGHTAVAQLLIAHGADIDAFSTGVVATPLQLAARRGHMATVEALVACGAILQGKRNPLSAAACGGPIPKEAYSFDWKTGAYTVAPASGATERSQMAMVEYLLSHGADPNGGALYAATACGRIRIMKRLIAAGADVNAKDSEGHTPVTCTLPPADGPHLEIYPGQKEAAWVLVEAGARVTLSEAAFIGALEQARSLILSGADVNARDRHSRTPLYLAAREGYPEIAALLIAQGADLNTAAEHRGETPLHMAIRQGHVEVAKLLIAAGADVNQKNDSQETPLQVAASEGCAGVIEYLVAKGADVNTGSNDRWSSPVARAMDRNHPEIVKALVAAGAEMTVRLAAYVGDVAALERFLINPAQDDPSRESLATLLNGAAEQGQKEAVQYLIAHGADPNGQDRWGYTPLHCAARGDQADIVALLLAHGVDVDAQGEYSSTPLHLAAQSDSREALKQLIEAGGNINVKNMWGQTPLHNAVGGGYLETAEILLAYGAEMNAADKEENTPLHYAVSLGRKAAVEFLLAKGADVNARNKRRQTPLHIAVSEPDRKMIITRYAYYDAFGASTDVYSDREMIELLLAHGADVDAADFDGFTPLHLAAAADRAEIAEALIAAGANVEARDRVNFTPLLATAAATETTARTATLLIGAGAKVNVQTDAGWTPLHYAARRGHVDIVQRLLDRDADTTIKTKQGLTALDCAESAGHYEIVQRIREPRRHRLDWGTLPRAAGKD